MIIDKVSDINYNDIVLNDSSWHNRIRAIKFVTDQEVIKKVALKDYDYRIRQEAIEKLTVPNYLLQVALQEKDSHLVCEAIKKISNQEHLKEIFLKRNDTLISLCIVENLTDDKILEYLLNNTTAHAVKSKIISLLSNEHLLLEIAFDGPYLNRIDAIERIIELNKPYSMFQLRQSNNYLIKQCFYDNKN